MVYSFSYFVLTLFSFTHYIFFPVEKESKDKQTSRIISPILFSILFYFQSVTKCVTEPHLFVPSHNTS